MARSQTFNNRRDLSTTDQRIGFNRPLSEDRITDQLRNPEGVYREAMESVASDDWERKCSGLGLLQRLIAQYPDIITQNLHQVVLILIQEVKNLRSQVARFALSTFCDMFKHLKRNMDIELDLTTKAIMQKNAESNEFFRFVNYLKPDFNKKIFIIYLERMLKSAFKQCWKMSHFKKHYKH